MELEATAVVAIGVVVVATLFATFDWTFKSGDDDDGDDFTGSKLEEVVQTRLVLNPLKIGNLTLRNRIIRAAAYAGSGLDEMKVCHEEVAVGGVGMTTIAYCAIHHDGRYAYGFDCGNMLQMNANGRRATSVPVCQAQNMRICIYK